MPVNAVSNYAIELANGDRDYSLIAGSSIDLLITDGNPLGNPAARALSDANVGNLIAQGRLVAGYVNVAVTDDNRYYWQSIWTNNGHDTGTVNSSTAPSWLQGVKPIDFDNDGNQDAFIVRYWDPAWQQIVIDQVLDLVSRGYNAIFLDDIGRYFQSSSESVSVQQAADYMLELIRAIHQAVPADIVLIANADPYITANSSDGVSGNLAQSYLRSIDYQLIENQPALTYDSALIDLPGEQLLVLQSSTPHMLTDAEGWARGILYNSPSANYDVFAGETPYPTTNGDDTIVGGFGPNRIDGKGGNDLLFGGRGNDTLIGGAGNDMLNGQAGLDTLVGGLGDDLYRVDNAGDSVTEGLNEGYDTVLSTVDFTLGANLDALYLSAGARIGTGNGLDNVIFGGGAADTLSGLGGNDNLRGLLGRDILNGGEGNDKLIGGEQRDTLTGGIGADQFRFETLVDSGNTRQLADEITDFSHAEGDRIILNLIDANTLVGGDQAFKLIGDAAFSHIAGELRYDVFQGNTYLQGDVNGDGVADIFIRVDGVQSFVNADFFF